MTDGTYKPAAPQGGQSISRTAPRRPGAILPAEDVERAAGFSAARPVSALKSPALWLMVLLIVGRAGYAACAAPAACASPASLIQSADKTGNSNSASSASGGQAAPSPSNGASGNSTTPAAAAKPGTKSHPDAHANPLDGVYEGNICYGKTPQRPNRCYPSAGTVRGKKITGQWIVPKQEGLTLFLEGDVGPSGDVKLHIHSQQPDGTVVATINMTGSIVDGKLEATGNFVNGRPANLFWRRKETIVPLPATK